MNYGSLPRSAGISSQRIVQLPSNCLSSSKHREYFAFYVGLLIPNSIPRRFPGKRGTPGAQKLPVAPSTWTLVGPEAHSDGNPNPRPDQSRQGTQDDPGPLDPSAWGPRVAGLEPPTLVERHGVPTPGAQGTPKPEDTLKARNEDASPATRSSSSPLVTKIKNFFKSKPFWFTLRIQDFKVAHRWSEEFSCF